MSITAFHQPPNYPLTPWVVIIITSIVKSIHKQGLYGSDKSERKQEMWRKKPDSGGRPKAIYKSKSARVSELDINNKNEIRS